MLGKDCFDTYDDTRYCAERKCLDDIFIKEIIGFGSTISVNIGCINDNCTYIVKVISTNNGEYVKEFNSEVAKTKVAHTLGLGPELLRFILCDVSKENEAYTSDIFGFMIMEKLDFSLAELIEDNRDLWLNNKDIIMEELNRLEHLTLNYQFANNDLHDSNIMVKIDNGKVERLFIIDYGNSLGFQDVSLIQEQWKEFREDFEEKIIIYK